MNQIMHEYTIYEQYCLLIVQAENYLVNKQDFEENFSNFIEKFTDEDRGKIITSLLTQYPGITFLKNQCQQFQPQVPSQSRIRGLPLKDTQQAFFHPKSKFEILQEYLDAKNNEKFEQLIDLMQQGQFFNYMEFPQILGEYKNILITLKKDSLKIWEIIEMSSKPALQININLILNILYFIFNKPKLDLNYQVKILELIGETTRGLIVQFQYLIKQYQINDEVNYENFINKLKTQQIDQQDQFIKLSYIYLIIQKIQDMNFENFFEYWFNEMSQIVQVNSTDKRTLEQKVIDAFYVNFEIQNQLYFITLFALWFQINKKQAPKSENQSIKPSRIRSAILVPNLEKNEGLDRMNSLTSRQKQQTQLDRVLNFSDQVPQNQKEISFLEDKQKVYIDQLTKILHSSPLKLFESFEEFLKFFIRLKKVSNYHFKEIFGIEKQVQSLIATSQLSINNLKKSFNFLRVELKKKNSDILEYFNSINQSEFQIQDKQVLLLIVFQYNNFDLEIFHFYFQQLKLENEQRQGRKAVHNYNQFLHGLDISLEEFKLSLTLVDETEKSSLIHKWIENIWDPISFRNLIPFFFNIFKREEDVQEILSQFNDCILNKQIDYCEQLNPKMLFQIFYNNSNQELQVMLLKLQSKQSPIPLLFRRNWFQDEEGEEQFILNENVFYVFQESYTIINFNLNQTNSQIGKTELINEIFQQDDKFETRDTFDFNSQTIDIMLDYSFCGTRNLTIADCHHLIPLKKLDKLLPLFKLWIIQVDGENEIDEMLIQLQQLSSFKQVEQKQIIVLIRNATMNQTYSDKLDKLTKLKIQYHQIKDLTNKKLNKMNIDQEIVKVSQKIYSIIAQYYNKSFVNQTDFIQILKNFNQSSNLNPQFKKNLDLIKQLKDELVKIIQQEDAFNSKDAFPIRNLEFNIKQLKEQYQSFPFENQEERKKIDENIRFQEKLLTSQNTTTILNIFCEIFSFKNYYILYLWFVETIRSFNNRHTYELIEENQKLMDQINKDKLTFKQQKDIAQKRNESYQPQDDQKIRNLQSSIQVKTTQLEKNQTILTKRQISIELFQREIISLSRHKPLPHDMNPPQIVNQLISKGEPFEFLNGDQLKIDQKFLEQLILNLQNQGKEKILVFSALGPQSSGKSTLLNKIFGCHFWTSVWQMYKGNISSASKDSQQKVFQ